MLIVAALVVIYIVLGILYESLIHPITVLSTLPSAGVGAVLALLMFRMEFSIIALIGVFLLIGIVKKNAILIIDFALEAERSRGLSPLEAVREASLLRFRPILMTTLAAALGALPLAIGFGDGAELRRPLGVADHRRPDREPGDDAADDAGRLRPPRQAAHAGAARRPCRPRARSPRRGRHDGAALRPAARGDARGGARRLRRRPRLRAAERAGAGRVQGSADRRRRRDLAAGGAGRHARARRLVAPVRRRRARPPRRRGRCREPDHRRRGRVATPRRRRWCAKRAPATTRRSALDASGRRFGGGNGSAGGTGTANAFAASLNGDWAPDFWGRVSRSVESARAGEQGSAADLAAARLSAQGALAIDYFALREADYEIELLARSIEGYERALQITQNRYDAGIAPKTDVLQAQTQLATTRASLTTVRANRERFEHAIAVLTGKAPGDFALAPAPWNERVPAIPLGVPSTLLQRRPDIASAERQVAAANAQIGVERSAYFPSLTLSASIGTAGLAFGDLFSAASPLWSFGARGGADGVRRRRDRRPRRRRRAPRTRSRSRATARPCSRRSRASRTSSATRARWPSRRYLLKQASDAADLTEQQILNRYRAGQLGYTDVVTAQASALSARRALVQTAVNRQVTAITLIQALGGGWDVAAPVELGSSVRADNAR